MIRESINIDDSVLEFLESATILCVEDNISTQLIYKSILAESVKDLICSKDGVDGYQKYLDNKIDIIITDYYMPNLNGLEMIRKIRKINNDIPIILVSSIEDLDVIKSAIRLHIHNFIAKPIETVEIVNAIINTSKVLIADKYIEEQRKKKLKTLEEKEKYNSYQEDLAFSKELNILKNDFYYQMINQDYTAMIDFMYKPLDTLSGDAYSARKINESKIFFLVVDGMGKGISASMSAMIFTSFVNHIIDISSEFDFNRLIYDSIEYIKPILLEEEALSVDYILLDCFDKEMSYAKFSMPASLVQSQDNKISKIKSNNPPISKYINNFKIDTFDTANSIKFLFFSDGVVENTTNIEDKTYADFIEDDFLHSFVKEDMREKFLQKVDEQEDDITFIYFNKLNLHENIITKKVFNTTLLEIDNATDWYTTVWENISDNNTLQYNSGVVFTELIMNAYEHGNLGLTSENKHILLEEDTYFSTLETMERACSKKITITINKINYMDNIYIVTGILDEGDGFDTNILSEIFRNKAQFNGRGVFVSRRSSLGIYFNAKGNEVLFLHKL